MTARNRHPKTRRSRSRSRDSALCSGLCCRACAPCAQPTDCGDGWECCHSGKSHMNFMATILLMIMLCTVQTLDDWIPNTTHVIDSHLSVLSDSVLAQEPNASASRRQTQHHLIGGLCDLRNSHSAPDAHPNREYRSALLSFIRRSDPSSDSALGLRCGCAHTMASLADTVFQCTVHCIISFICSTANSSVQTSLSSLSSVRCLPFVIRCLSQSIQYRICFHSS